MTRLTFTNRTALSLAAALLCLAPLAVVPSGCKMFRKTPLQSVVQTRDPRTAGQLLKAFSCIGAPAVYS